MCVSRGARGTYCKVTVYWYVYGLLLHIVGTECLTTTSCILLHLVSFYISIYYISYLFFLPGPRCSGTISCGIAYVYPLYLGYYILWLRLGMVLYLVYRNYSGLPCSCHTVTTRFSPTRRRFSRGLQYKGKSVPPNTESFHLANSTRCSTCNIAYTTTSCGFSRLF